MSGIFSPITNAHRYFRSTIDTTPVGAGKTTSDVWVTMPFVNFGKLTRFVLQTQNAIGGSPVYSGNVTVCVLNDGASSRTLMDAPVGVTMPLDASGRIGSFEFNDTYYEDQYRTRKLYLRIHGDVIYQPGLYFNVGIEGKQQQPFWNSDWEINFAKSYKHDRIFRQLSDGTIVNLTNELRQNGNPYTFGGSVDATKPYVVLANQLEYLYIGSDERFDTVYFDIPEAYRLGVGNTVVNKEYWNGTAWTPMINMNDNTSSGQYNDSVLKTDSTGFNFSGVYNWVPAVDWTPYDMPNDPDVILRNGMTTGALLPVYIGVVRPKYWMRFSVPALAQDLAMTWVGIWKNYL